VALGLTQPLIEMSIRDISWGKGSRCVGLTSLPSSWSRNLDTSTFWSPQGVCRVYSVLPINCGSYNIQRHVSAVNNCRPQGVNVKKDVYVLRTCRRRSNGTLLYFLSYSFPCYSDLYLATHCRCRESLLLLITFSDTHTHRAGRTPLDEWSVPRRDRYLHNTQQTQDTNIHALSGIRTCITNKPAAADPRVRPRGQLVLINKKFETDCIGLY